MVVTSDVKHGIGEGMDNVFIVYDHYCSSVNNHKDFQKLGSRCNFLSKLEYHVCKVLSGTYVSEGFGLIDCWVVANDEEKLNRFCNIFWVNSTNAATPEGVALGSGVCCAISCSGSREIPICAIVWSFELVIEANGLWPPSSSLTCRQKWYISSTLQEW